MAVSGSLCNCCGYVKKKPFIPESASKVPREIRQRYFKLFFEHYLKICSTVDEAGGKARIEEQSIYDRCGSKNMYLNFAVKTVKKLRDHGQSSDIKTPSGAGSVKADNEKVAGGLEKHYSCCEGIVGSPGCQIAKCYTSQGLELTRVTVVDDKLQVVYDTFVKPHNEVIDYNTSFSGVTEDNLKNTKTTLRDVQAVLLNLFSADTILIGHSLENDFFVLKLIHDTVVDTSILFPHRLGPPNKRALRSLMADYLMRIHQGDVNGHNSTEDAIACMELIFWKIKEDKKRRK